MRPVTNLAGQQLGADNRAAVLSWQIAHPWGTQQECAAELGLSLMAVNRHVRAIREMWRK
jgi:predicted transcriptional regulator